MPSSWFKLEENSQALQNIKEAFGSISDPMTVIVSGDGSKVFSEEASRYIYENLDKGFPYSEEAIK